MYRDLEKWRRPSLKDDRSWRLIEFGILHKEPIHIELQWILGMSQPNYLLRKINVCKRVHIELGFLMTNELEAALALLIWGILNPWYFSLDFCKITKTNPLSYENVRFLHPFFILKSELEENKQKLKLWMPE